MTYRLILPAIYMLFLLTMATMPPPSLPALPYLPGFKWHHAGAFFVCTVLLGWAFRPFFRRIGWRLYALSIGISFALGGVIEYVQRYLPYRSGQASDLVPNLIGILCGWMILVAWGCFERRSSGGGAGAASSGVAPQERLPRVHEGGLRDPE